MTQPLCRPWQQGSHWGRWVSVPRAALSAASALSYEATMPQPAQAVCFLHFPADFPRGPCTSHRACVFACPFCHGPYGSGIIESCAGCGSPSWIFPPLLPPPPLPPSPYHCFVRPDPPGGWTLKMQQTSRHFQSIALVPGGLLAMVCSPPHPHPQLKLKDDPWVTSLLCLWTTLPHWDASPGLHALHSPLPSSPRSPFGGASHSLPSLCMAGVTLTPLLLPRG